VNEGQAFLIVAAAVYVCFQVTYINLRLRALQRFFEDREAGS
jgi:hypothetical protein